MLLPSLLCACGAATGTGAEDPSSSAEGAAEGGAQGAAAAPFASLDEQLTTGAQLFEEQCAGCHGSDGAGKKSSPPIMGPNALSEIPPAGALRRTVPFKTAHDVIEWTAEAMPSDDPGSLTRQQYEAIVAHQLTVIGVDLRGAPLTADNARSIFIR